MDPKSAGQLMAEAGEFFFGNIDRVVERFDEFRAASMDEIVLDLTGVCKLYGAKAAMDNLANILAAVGVERRGADA